MTLVTAVGFAVLVLVLAIAGLTGALLQQRRQCRELQTGLVRLTNEAAQSRTDLRQRTELDSVKDEFISTVSHELRTPLTSIRGALGLLSAGLMGKVDDRAANLLRIASTNTDRLVRLINDILDLERMDSGNAPIRLRPCSLRELVLQSVDTMTAMAHEAGVQLETAFGTHGGTVIFEGDPDRLQQVFTNLLSNAIKFSPSGSIIHIRTSTDATDLSVQVEDQGRGVPVDKLDTIFGRFHQVEAADSRQKGGTGLGLAICRSIVHQHGGDIWAERNDNRVAGTPGTTFVVRLPRNHATETAAQHEAATNGAILVVDDDSGVRHVVAEHIRNQGYTVLEADSGQAALQTAEKQQIEAILLDLYMPGLTGWETIERLKGNPATSSIPIVVLSVLSPATLNTHRAPVMAKAQGWVQKPFHPGILLAELGRVLHRGNGPARILLVEDDADLATVVLASFVGQADSSPVRIDHAASLNEAVRACETNPPELLVLDLSLPDGSGFALVNWLRRQPTLRTLPLVVYSGREVSTAEMEQLRLGPTQFLTKARVQPKEIENLVLAMVRHLQAPAMEYSAGI